MIEKLGTCGENIFDVTMSDDKATLTLTEACDLWFETALTKAQVLELADDFRKLAEQMTP